MRFRKRSDIATWDRVGCRDAGEVAEDDLDPTPLITRRPRSGNPHPVVREGMSHDSPLAIWPLGRGGACCSVTCGSYVEGEVSVGGTHANRIPGTALHVGTARLHVPHLMSVDTSAGDRQAAVSSATKDILMTTCASLLYVPGARKLRLSVDKPHPTTRSQCRSRVKLPAISQRSSKMPVKTVKRAFLA